MAKLSAAKLPGTLAELPRISLRALPAGGPVLRDPRPTPSDLLLNTDEVLLLVHGFANGEQAAFASYRRFMANVGAAWSARASGVLWAGDGTTRNTGAPQRWQSAVLTAFSYPWQSQRAEESARYLADVLSASCVTRRTVAALRGRPPRELTVNVVAHSMGCRLALATIGLLRSAVLADAGIRIRHVALMAAAVPTYHIAARGALELALLTADRTTVYWSREDHVLRFAFPLGQALERPFPLGWKPRSRVALGRGGIAGSAKLGSVQVGLGHSEYWSDKDVARRILADLDSRQPAVNARLVTRRVLGRRTLGTRARVS